MKRLTLPASASRHQRGFFRVTALVGLVGLTGAGIATTQQVKAHQHSHHIAAVKKSAVKDCGCRLPAFKAHKASLYQTAADADGNNYEQAVSLKAGQRLALGISDPAGSVQPGGAWDTQFGTVDPNGVYTAPSFTPPEGLDRIHYLDPQGDDVYVDVRIMPNPAIPNSDQIPYVTVADASSDAMQGGGGSSPQVQQAQPADASDGSDTTFAPTSQTIVVAPGETPAPPLQINGTTPLIGEIVNGANVLVLPALFGDGTTSAIYAQPLDETPQVVTLTPDVVPPSGPCTSGETAVYGPVRTTYAPEPGSVNLADFVVNAGFKADAAKYFGVTLNIGATYHVQGKYYDWKQERTKYVYACSNKHWVFIYTRQCDSLATSLTTTPPFAILGTGYPRNNMPRPYGPEACH